MFIDYIIYNNKKFSFNPELFYKLEQNGETLFDTIEQIILNAIYFKMSLFTIFMPRTKATSYFEICFVYKYLIIKMLFISQYIVKITFSFVTS